MTAQASVQVAVLEPELDRLEALWSDGLADTFHAYMEHVNGFEAETRPKLALAAALIEVGVRLQGLGAAAAPPTTLLVGDLCLARGSRLLADHAPKAVQIAFARSVELLSSRAAAKEASPAPRQLLRESLAAK